MYDEMPSWEREARAAARYDRDLYTREQREQQEERRRIGRERRLRDEDPAELGILPRAAEEQNTQASSAQS